MESVLVGVFGCCFACLRVSARVRGMCARRLGCGKRETGGTGRAKRHIMEGEGAPGRTEKGNERGQ